ncbi:MAG TPA: MOSC domain-containing protein [Thermomicrobiales bacterium]|nr:MOSC domain-containing protein [Thermomicrobiales bacterium]
MTHPVVLSIQVGMPRTMVDESGIDQLDAQWISGIYKDTVQGPVRLTVTGPEGDGQADLVYHGGPHQAVLLYAASHYPAWREELGRPDLVFGDFGENLTVEGLTEADVCIGDRYELGETLLEVSQPRQPCWKLSRRNGVAGLAQEVVRKGLGGWYVRVLREGNVEAGQELIRLARPYPDWTILRANDIIYGREADPVTRAALAACPAISPRWKEALSGTAS